MGTLSVWRSALADSRAALEQFSSDSEQLKNCGQFEDLLVALFQRGGNLFVCGNGGSHCDAMHFAEELTGRYRKERKPLGALALGDSSHLTCVSNDYGFEHVFVRQLQGLARSGDLLVGLSTSGNSANVIRVFEAAKQMGVGTVALLGRGGGKLGALAELSIRVPGQSSDRIQELHIKVIHTVIEACERRLFPENYSDEP